MTRPWNHHLAPLGLFLLWWLVVCLPDTMALSSSSSLGNPVVLVKIGGSSITQKNQLETLHETNLKWFAETLASLVASRFRTTTNEETTPVTNDNAPAFIIIHGAGSFGHHHAKEFGLSGKQVPASNTSASIMDEPTRRRTLFPCMTFCVLQRKS